MLDWRVAADDGRALRDDIGEWHIPGGDWSAVGSLVDDAISAVRRRDLAGAREALARLELLSPLAAPRQLRLRRAPAPVLERLDTLVIALDQAVAEHGGGRRENGLARRKRWWHVRR